MINLHDKNFITTISEWEINDLMKTIDTDSIFLIHLDWKKIKTEFDIYECFSNIIHFPEYFWNNWDAFWDIMRDNDFITKDVNIFIKNINDLHIDYNDKKIFFITLIKLLHVPYLNKKIQVFIIN